MHLIDVEGQVYFSLTQGPLLLSINIFFVRSEFILFLLGNFFWARSWSWELWKKIKILLQRKYC